MIEINGNFDSTLSPKPLNWTDDY